jgi:antitoxin VapB
MALDFRDKETEKLAAEIAALTGESEEEVVRQSLRERRDRIEPPEQSSGRRPRTMEEMLHFMETEIWPLIPEEHRGRPPMTKAERAKLLGYGPDET